MSAELAISYGAGARPAAEPSDPYVAVSTPIGTFQAASVQPWEGETSDYCAILKSDGERCHARAKRGESYCAGHLRQLEG